MSEHGKDVAKRKCNTDRSTQAKNHFYHPDDEAIIHQEDTASVAEDSSLSSMSGEDELVNEDTKSTDATNNSAEERKQEGESTAGDEKFRTEVAFTNC